MHVSPTKHSYAVLPKMWLPDRRTDRQTPDKWSLCAAMLRRRHTKKKLMQCYCGTDISSRWTFIDYWKREARPDASDYLKGPKIKANFQLHSSENNVEKWRFSNTWYYNAKYDCLYLKTLLGNLYLYNHMRRPTSEHQLIAEEIWIVKTWGIVALNFSVRAECIIHVYTKEQSNPFLCLFGSVTA